MALFQQASSAVTLTIASIRTGPTLSESYLQLLQNIAFSQLTQTTSAYTLDR
jgi:hypothetical protein